MELSQIVVVDSAVEPVEERKIAIGLVAFVFVSHVVVEFVVFGPVAIVRVVGPVGLVHVVAAPVQQQWPEQNSINKNSFLPI